MGLKFTFATIFGAAILAAAPALAWSDRSYTQPTAKEIAVWAYPSKQNYCPVGLQPVTIGGVIYCGQPTHVGYQTHPTPRRQDKPKLYVAYGKGYREEGVGN